MFINVCFIREVSSSWAKKERIFWEDKTAVSLNLHWQTFMQIIALHERRCSTWIFWSILQLLSCLSRSYFTFVQSHLMHMSLGQVFCRITAPFGFDDISTNQNAEPSSLRTVRHGRRDGYNTKQVSFPLHLRLFQSYFYLASKQARKEKCFMLQKKCTELF